MVAIEGDQVAFRHELLRRAVADTSTFVRQRANHARIFAALPDGTEAATVVHHAEGAGDTGRLVGAATAAAAAAADAESFPEAMAHYERALARPKPLSRDDSFELWYGLARARLLAGVFTGVIDAAERSVEIARDLDDPVNLGRALASHARIASHVHDPPAVAIAEEAVAVTEALGMSVALTEALAARAYVTPGLLPAHTAVDRSTGELVQPVEAGLARFSLDPDAWLEAVCDRVSRELTPAELHAVITGFEAMSPCGRGGAS